MRFSLQWSHARTLTECDRWKLGQLRPGSTIRFQPVSYEQARELYLAQEKFFLEFQGSIKSPISFPQPLPSFQMTDGNINPRLHQTSPEPSSRPPVVFRQAGDSAILVEFGDMMLDFAIRARIHAFEAEVRRRAVPGVWFLAPCIRSTMVSSSFGLWVS